MNLQKLFKIQSKLDERIIHEHGLQGQDLLDKKILALQVEVGELANEARFFKFWSHDQKPRVKEFPKGTCYCKEHDGYWCDKLHESEAEAKGIYVNPLLEEYVDCLHFILSIGLELGIKNYKILPHKQETIVDQFIELNYQAYIVLQRNENHKGKYKDKWYMLVDLFIGLGEMLGFTEQQIEQAYLDKNKINHTRQDVGY